MRLTQGATACPHTCQHIHWCMAVLHSAVGALARLSSMAMNALMAVCSSVTMSWTPV